MVGSQYKLLATRLPESAKYIAILLCKDAGDHVAEALLTRIRSPQHIGRRNFPTRILWYRTENSFAALVEKSFLPNGVYSVILSSCILSAADILR